MEFIAASIAFALVTLTAMIIGLLSPRKPNVAERKPNPTPYVGPCYNAHGREIEPQGRRII